MLRRSGWLVALCCAASCAADHHAGNAPASNADTASMDLAGRKFLFESATGFEVVENAKPLLSFREGELTMKAGCNIVTGHYTVRNGVLLVPGISRTDFGCFGPAYHQDVVIGEFLKSKPELRLDDVRLTLSNATTSMTFLDREIADPDRPLTATLWAIDMLIEDGGSTLGIMPQPTIVFSEDGELQSETGCKKGTGRYAVNDDQLTLSGMSYTGGECGKGFARTDSHVQAVLTDGMLTFSIEAARLILERGDLGLSARARE